MATKYISSITLPNGDVANLVDKSSGYTTNTGTVTDVKINNTSVVSSGIATIATNGIYNATNNPLATMADLGTIEVLNITTTYVSSTDTWILPTETVENVISAFTSGDVVILSFNDDGDTYYCKITDYTGSASSSGTVSFADFSENCILILSFDSNGWNGANVIVIPDNTVVTGLDYCAYQVREASNSNLNTWINPGTYEVYSGDTYTNLPSFNGYSFTSGIVEVLGLSDSGTITQRFITSDSSSSGSNIFAIRHSTNGGSSWTSWRYDNDMSSHLNWSSGAHDANYAPPGTIWCRNGSSYTTNLPGSGTYGMLVTTGYWALDNSCSHQTYTEYSSSNLSGSPSTTGVYVRDSFSGNWSTWVKIGPASYTDANNISY